MESPILKSLLPLVVIALLSACANAPPGPESGPARPDQVGAMVLQGQPAPPVPQLEHPGRPPASGHLWIAGYWDWVGASYDWVPGRWVPPRPGQVWLPRVWRSDGQRWYAQGGRWEPDPNDSLRTAEKRRR